MISDGHLTHNVKATLSGTIIHKECFAERVLASFQGQNQ